jgi:hypothetical protein
MTEARKRKERWTAYDIGGPTTARVPWGTLERNPSTSAMMEGKSLTNSALSLTRTSYLVWVN